MEEVEGGGVALLTWTPPHTDVMQLVFEVGIQLLSTRRRVHMVSWGTEAHTGVAIPL